MHAIGAGGGVRFRACPLRVVAYDCEYGTVTVACFPNGRFKLCRFEDDRSVLVAWWLPTAKRPRWAVLRWPLVQRGWFKPRAGVMTDVVLAEVFRKLARAKVAEARPVVRAIMRWEARRGPCPWRPATLEGPLAQVAPLHPRSRSRRKPRDAARPMQQSA
jgi:hypothetical protein